MKDGMTLDEIDVSVENGGLAEALYVGVPEPPLYSRRLRLGLLTASALMQMYLPPVRYILPGYIAEGLTILAGRPKRVSCRVPQHVDVDRERHKSFPTIRTFRPVELPPVISAKTLPSLTCLRSSPSGCWLPLRH
jgi:hypothetical protein